MSRFGNPRALYIFGFVYQIPMKLSGLGNTISFSFLLALFLSIALFSCVPNSQITYVQDQELEDISTLEKYEAYKTLMIQPFEYKIKPDDILQITVRDNLDEENKDLNYFNLGPGMGQGGQQQNMMMMPGAAALSGYIVESDGFIELPVYGKYKAEGKTIRQIRDEIQVIARETIMNREDLVTDVRLMNFQFFILGAVGQSSLYQTFQPKLNVLEALSMAGGLAIDADRENIRLLRRYGNELEVIPINLLDDKFIGSEYFYLMPNDMIIVDPLPVRNVTLAQSTVTTAIGFGLTIFNLILLLSR
jgi:polysaccharide export outer membrane protein